MSMFNDISCDRKGNKEECLANAGVVKVLAKKFGIGQWSFGGPCSEKKWYSAENSPQGAWDNIAEKCCWNLQRVDILFSEQRLHCPEVLSKASGEENCLYTSPQIKTRRARAPREERHPGRIPGNGAGGYPTESRRPLVPTAEGLNLDLVFQSLCGLNVLPAVLAEIQSPVPGSEKMWYSMEENSPQGIWDHIVKKMLLEFAESGCPIFRATTPLSR